MSRSRMTRRRRRREGSRRGQRPLPDRAGRQDLHPRRAVRLRQDDRRSRWSTGSSSRPRARITIDGVDVTTREVTELRRRHRLRDPAGRPVPAPDDRRERRHGAAPARLAEGAPAGAVGGAARHRRPGARPSTATATRASCPAASGSASASLGRLPPTRRSCSWTSRSAPSIRSSATASRTSSCASRRRSPRRSCS